MEVDENRIRNHSVCCSSTFGGLWESRGREQQRFRLGKHTDSCGVDLGRGSERDQRERRELQR